MTLRLDQPELFPQCKDPLGAGMEADLSLADGKGVDVVHSDTG